MKYIMVELYTLLSNDVHNPRGEVLLVSETLPAGFQCALKFLAKKFRCLVEIVPATPIHDDPTSDSSDSVS